MFYNWEEHFMEEYNLKFNKNHTRLFKYKIKH